MAFGFIAAKEKLKFSDEEMMKLASETCKNLEQTSSNYVSAAVIALDYLDDVERAVANFCVGEQMARCQVDVLREKSKRLV